MYYCFNDECERWGEPQDPLPGMGIVLIKAFAPGVSGKCESCGDQLYFHDAWDGNHRTDDDYRPIDVDAPVTLRAASST